MWATKSAIKNHSISFTNFFELKNCTHPKLLLNEMKSRGNRQHKIDPKERWTLQFDYHFNNTYFPDFSCPSTKCARKISIGWKQHRFCCSLRFKILVMSFLFCFFFFFRYFCIFSYQTSFDAIQGSILEKTYELLKLHKNIISDTRAHTFIKLSLLEAEKQANLDWNYFGIYL